MLCTLTYFHRTSVGQNHFTVSLQGIWFKTGCFLQIFQQGSHHHSETMNLWHSDVFQRETPNLSSVTPIPLSSQYWAAHECGSWGQAPTQGLSDPPTPPATPAIWSIDTPYQWYVYLDADRRTFTCSIEGQAIRWTSSGLNSSFNKT